MLKEVRAKIKNFGRELAIINKEPYRNSTNLIEKHHNWS